MSLETTRGDDERQADQRDAGRLFFHDDLVIEFQEACAPRQRALLSLLAISQKFDLDPAPLISSLADDLPRTPLESRRRTRKFFWARVGQMAEDVKQADAEGPTHSFLDILKHYPRILPANVELGLRLEDQNKRLPQLFGSWLSRSPSYDTLQRDPLLVGAIGRGLVLLMFLVSMASFVLIKVAPELKSMLSEFAIEPPAPFMFGIHVADMLVKLWFLPTSLLLVGLVFCVPAFRTYLRRWNPFIWRQPNVPSSVRTRRALAMLIEHGKERVLPSTFLGLKQVRRDVGVDDKKGAVAGVGHLEWERLKSKGKISQADFDALSTSTSKVTQGWLLRKSADLRLKSSENREKFIARTILTSVNILLGIVVSILAFGIFSVMITLMESLS